MKQISIISLIIIASCNNKMKPSEFHTKRMGFLKNFKDFTTLNTPTKYKNLIDTLKNVYYDDQLYRDNKEPKYYLQNYKKQDVLDKKNQTIILSILDRYGYLGIKDVGFIGNAAISITLDHAPYDIKLRYLPIIEAAFQNKNMSPGLYTIYKDKMAMKEHRLQEYGTQIITLNTGYSFYPLDINKTEINRKRIGLKQDLKSYLRTFFNTEFDSAKYVEILPDLIKKFDIK